MYCTGHCGLCLPVCACAAQHPALEAHSTTSFVAPQHGMDLIRAAGACVESARWALAAAEDMGVLTEEKEEGEGGGGAREGAESHSESSSCSSKDNLTSAMSRASARANRLAAAKNERRAAAKGEALQLLLQVAFSQQTARCARNLPAHTLAPYMSC